MGLANIAGGLFLSFAVAGGFSRTAINADSGARRNWQVSFVTVASWSQLCYFLVMCWQQKLPYAILGAIIMASIIGLIDIATLKSAWQRDRLDAASFIAAFAGVLIFGLNTGLVIGLMVSFAA